MSFSFQFIFRTKLSSVKLKQLHTELKVHDKETMSLKKLKADGMDKEGLKEAEIRKRFNSIMFSYGLAKSTDTKLDESKVKVIIIHSEILNVSLLKFFHYFRQYLKIRN